MPLPSLRPPLARAGWCAKRSVFVPFRSAGERTIATSRDGQGAKTPSFTTTMFRSAPRTTRSAVRLLTPQKLTRLNTSSRHQFLGSSSSLPLQDQIFAASTSVPTSLLQTRHFTSKSRNSSRHLRSGDLRRTATVNERPAGVSDDDLPRKSRRANPFLPFQASSFVDAFVTTIVGVGISESCRFGRVRQK